MKQTGIPELGIYGYDSIPYRIAMLLLDGLQSHQRGTGSLVKHGGNDGITELLPFGALHDFKRLHHPLQPFERQKLGLHRHQIRSHAASALTIMTPKTGGQSIST